ncbi:thioether cross-link-forming SCIFF peptide maturase [Eubacterium pyruvativorans]|uniref:thioether cross-link-forming SCIFF peptide maturase n=1 Tax=Eubacterium pyruvativorans TaxID=155865 RepID=UPI00156629E3|nr:thioether cross-link-forming SCIFF peptide maturase [Eubacterium pyruvativorans]MCI5746616.1 thioether cross-link-forming SCIFF peptide maturase [Eubacterium pyruvativorans]MDD7684865.1 thioether cross-link-forming SCIFF peptide maturase [Eubacterium pyruvativorans]MDY4049581.1 thioether cross-link-forming SCIFF peptide maturase [Eubacterium pyruvativorans]
MVHQYKLNGYNIVLDVNSGSVHCVDDVAYDIISFFCEAKDRGLEPDRDRIQREILAKYADRDDVTPEDIDDTFADIDELTKEEKLFAEDIFEPSAGVLKERHTEVKALCLHVAHTCNLNCSYCFASQGKFHGERAIMSMETAKRAIDFLVENSGNHVNLEVDFFGGEPLLNWDVVKGTVAYARSIEKEHGKNFRFTLTTNGVGLNDEVMDFANREMHNVVLSLDGRKETHDRLRKFVDGRGSYDVIVPKFQEFVKRRGDKEYYMRGTFTHDNVDFTKDLFHMVDLGFDRLSMEPVVCDPSEPYALTEEDLPKIYEQYEILAKYMLQKEKEGHPITFYHYMLDLTGGPCIYKRISGCGSGTEYFAVTPWGDLFPCHQFVGEEQFKMGDIWNGIQREDIRQDFKMCNVYAREECRDCWARLYCSGGCAANAFHGTGDIRGVYEYGCDIFRKRMECAIMMQVAERMDPVDAQE